MMKVPDLDQMVQEEEYVASGECIHCGKTLAMHTLVWIKPWQSDPGRVGWQCYPNIHHYMYERRNEDS